MLKERSEVLSRPRFKNIFTAARIKELLSLLDSYAIVVSPSQKVSACRDEKDNFLLALIPMKGEEPNRFWVQHGKERVF